MDEKSREDDQRFLASPSEETAQAAISSSLRGGEPGGAALAWALELQTWDTLGVETQEVAAKAVAALLADEGFEFNGLETCDLGEIRRSVAYFSKGARELALIPGGTASLGGKREEALELLEADPWVLDWLEGMGGRVESLLTLTPPRVVELAPFLIERQGWAWNSDEASEAEIDRMEENLRAFGVDGLRLPSGDEWEHACGGGSRGLFRWGSEIGSCPYEGEDFDLHKAPNAFGLRLPWNTYTCELCSDASVRGGDGGSAICGAEPRAMAWLALATSFDCSDMVENIGCLEAASQIRLARTVPLPNV